MSMPPVSVVIATRDRAVELERTLRELAALPERPEVIVVDNGSGDGTPARASRALPTARVIALGANRGAAARNAGVAAAAGRYVAFCDDDSCWAPGSLERAAELLDAHPQVGLLAARVLVGSERALEPACAAMAASPLAGLPTLPGPRVLGFVACGAVVRREAFLEAGGFHARFGVGGEEALLAADLADRGWALVYADELVAFHRPSGIRDGARRRAVVQRNKLWFTWLRRPLPRVVRSTLAARREARRDPVLQDALREALAGWRWILAGRRAVSPAVEADLCCLDAQGPAA
jgi:GT2 family glycosyltransferase